MQRFPIYLLIPHLHYLSSYQLPHETGLFLATDEPILTHYNHPKSIIYQDSLLVLYVLSVQFSSVQFSSVAQSCPTLCDPINRSTPGLPVHYQLPEFAQTHAHWVRDAIQPSHPLSSPSPPAPNPSQHQGLSNESTLRTKWPKYWSFSFSISPSNEHPGLISFRMDWLDLLAVQETLKSLLQHHSSKASIIRRSAGLHKGIVACVHHYSITESSFTPKNPLCSAHSSFHSPQFFQSLVFTPFIILPFPECHIVGII